MNRRTVRSIAPGQHLPAVLWVIQGHARRLGIEKLIASKDKDSHLIHNLGEGKDIDAESSSALPPDDSPDDGLDFDVIRGLESHSNCFLCDSKDHRLATCPQLTRIKGNDLAMRVCVAAIGPRRDPRPNDRPPTSLRRFVRFSWNGT
jgi:hypothetical protein